MLSKEKILLLDNNHASRLDLTIALTENPNLNSNQLNSIIRTNLGIKSKFGFIKSLNTKEDNQNNNYNSARENDMSFNNVQKIKANYNTCNNNKTLVSSPGKNAIIQSVKDQKNNGSIFKKIKNMIFSERKVQI